MQSRPGTWSNTALWVGFWLICLGVISASVEVWTGHKLISWWSFVTAAVGMLIFAAGFLREWLRGVLRALGLTRKDR